MKSTGQAELILAKLISLKNIKDTYGKTERYEREQPIAWEAARKYMLQYELDLSNEYDAEQEDESPSNRPTPSKTADTPEEGGIDRLDNTSGEFLGCYCKNCEAPAKYIATGNVFFCSKECFKEFTNPNQNRGVQQMK